MQRCYASRTTDPYGRYYTRGGVAELLISTMGVSPSGVVIDLGAGDGALVGEASRHWTLATFITVDIDGNAGSSRLPGVGRPAFSHHVADALDPQLEQKIGLTVGSAQSALCNPPYIRPRWRKHFAEILEEAGLSGVVPKIGCVPADVLFIAQNLRFLRPGGKLGLILPDGIIAGEKCLSLRQSLIAAHRLERVIELPRRVFCGTDAKAHIVVLTKHGTHSDTVSLQRLESDGTLAKVVELSADHAGRRLDYSFHSSRDATRSISADTVRLRDVVESVSRGSFSSKELRLCDFPVLHTTDFESRGAPVPRRFYLSKSRATAINAVIARPGDILIARVGRNLEDKVTLLKRGLVALSDCVLRVRVDPRHQPAVYRFLQTDAGRNALSAASHGVGAKFITTDALLNLKINGCEA